MSLRNNFFSLLTAIILSWSFSEAVFNGYEVNKAGCIVQVGIKLFSGYTNFLGPGVYIEKDIANFHKLGFYRNYKFARLGGVLVSCNILATMSSPDDVIISANTISRTDYKKSVQRNVKIIQPHPKWDGGSEYDICLLILDHVMNEVKTCELEKKHHLVNTNATVCGWGTTTTTCQLQPPILYEECLHCSTDRIMNKDECIALYNLINLEDAVTDTSFCLSSQASGGSIIDLGAPVFNTKTEKLIGLVTYTPIAGCKKGNRPAVVTSSVHIVKFVSNLSTWCLEKY